MLDESKTEAADTSVKWSSLIRGGAAAKPRINALACCSRVHSSLDALRAGNAGHCTAAREASRRLSQEATNPHRTAKGL